MKRRVVARRSGRVNSPCARNGLRVSRSQVSCLIGILETSVAALPSQPDVRTRLDGVWFHHRVSWTPAANNRPRRFYADEIYGWPRCNSPTETDRRSQINLGKRRDESTSLLSLSPSLLLSFSRVRAHVCWTRATTLLHPLLLFHHLHLLHLFPSVPSLCSWQALRWKLLNKSLIRNSPRDSCTDNKLFVPFSELCFSVARQRLSRAMFASLPRDDHHERHISFRCSSSITLALFRPMAHIFSRNRRIRYTGVTERRQLVFARPSKRRKISSKRRA